MRNSFKCPTAEKFARFIHDLQGVKRSPRAIRLSISLPSPLEINHYRLPWGKGIYRLQYLEVRGKETETEFHQDAWRNAVDVHVMPAGKPQTAPQNTLRLRK